ncbi:MAG: type II secretion system F family protein [Patescibacteria group bacterium]|jgi:type IV pilus assembly protein PilC
MNEKKHRTAWQSFKLSFYRLGLRKQVYDFLENFTALLSSGMNISEALGSISSDTKSKRMKRIINDIKDDVDNGVAFSQAILTWEFLPDRMVSLIKLGELSGKLADNLGVIVTQNEKDMVFRSKVRSSLIYSLIVLTLAIVVGAFTAWFVLPKMTEAFISFGAELPLITRIMIQIGKVLGDFGYIIVPFFFLFVASMTYFLFSFPKTKFIGHSLLFHIPFVKTLIRESETARFGFLLGTMLNAGLPVVESLNAMPGTTTFRNYREFLCFSTRQCG